MGNVTKDQFIAVLNDAGVTEDKLPEIARVAISDGCMMYNPDDVSYAEALAILTRAF